MDDERGFAAFYRDHREHLYRAVAVTLGDVRLAEEAVDEAFTRAAERWSQVGALRRPAGWVYRVAVNWATSWRRKLSGRPTRPAEELDRAHHDRLPDADRIPVIAPVGTDQTEATIILCDGQRCPAPTDEQLASLLADLDGDPNVAATQRDTPEQTRQRFADELDHLPDLAEQLGADQLPATLHLEVRDLIRLQDTYLDATGIDRIVTAGGLPSPLTRQQLIAELAEFDDLDSDTIEVLHTQVIDEALVVVAEAEVTVEWRERHEELGLEPPLPDRAGVLAVWIPDPEGLWAWIQSTATYVPIASEGWAATDELPSGQRVLGWGSTRPAATVEMHARSGLTATYDLGGQPSGLTTIDQQGDPTVATP